MLSSSSSSPTSQQKYDVFLSFRGEDTRNTFTDHLYAALKRKGIVTFKDDRNLEAGEEITPELLKAIQESWCSVIVFSRTYTFSSWCLEELAAIVQQKKEREHKVFPIFYYVDPSDLRKQTEKVREAFVKHEERYKENKNKTQRWRAALTEVSDVKGWHLENKPESEFIEEIVDKIYSVVPHKMTGSIFTSKDFMPSKSSTLTFNQIINALNTKGVNMIGLHGMPGVGKTTLAKVVMKHVKEQKLFDNVVMVTMSQTPDISKIQDRIAESLGLDLKARTEDGKAEELQRRLKDFRKIFIIIDDVWNEFELQTIGIPFGDEHQGCKILLTMRLKKVCFQMNCQEKFQLHVLSGDEAWALFKVKAGLKDVSSTLNDVAKEVASECKGLPLAIVAVGKALKGECLDGWIAANKRFKDSRHSDNEDVCEGVYSSLRLSYDYLKGDNIRSCFLLCSLFPEDCRIDIELLIMFAIGQGLFFDIDLLIDLRREIREAVKKLYESGLLLKIDGDDDDLNVKMHDVVRDFAHWIASKGENMFMVKEGLAEWPISKRLECYSAICFWNSNINNFLENLEFSKLKILVFENRFFWPFKIGSSLVRVPSTFVQGMKALQVLFLQNTIFSLEVSKFLINLRSLCCVRCRLKNISLLRNMENLEILELIDTDIYELPEELLALHKLKSLHFSCEEEVIEFPPNLLSRLTSLQELHVGCKNSVNLLELNSLSRLTTLSLLVSTAQCFPENFVFPKLQRYIIDVNQQYTRFLRSSNFRSLTIDDFSSSLRAFEELFCNVKELILKNVRETRNIVDPNLEGLKKEEISGLTPLFSNLTRLELVSLPKLENIWKLQPFHHYHVSLQSLKVVRIMKCKKLKSIFSTCVAQNLLLLQRLTVSLCNRLQQVFDFSQKVGELEVQSLSSLTYLELKSLRKLRCIRKGPTHLVNLQSLKTMRICDCHNLAYLFPTALAQNLVNLEVLVVRNCDSLTHVIIEEAAENEDEIVPNMDDYSLCWPKLNTLQIIGCRSLRYLFPITLAQGLPYLEYFEITNCSQVKQVFNVAKETHGVDDAIALPRLQHLQLEKLINLSCFCSENYPIVSPSLEKLIVNSCPRLENFGIQQVNKVVQLQDVPLYAFKKLLCNPRKLTLKCGEGLECLIDSTDQGRAPTSAFFNLVELDVREMSGLKMLCKGRFSMGFMQKIEIVRIMNCDQLQVVFETEGLLHDMEENQALPLSKLTSLQLKLLPELKWIWKGPCSHVCLQSLKVAKIQGCNRLKYLFSPSLAQSLVLLEKLNIEYCDELDHIITTGLEIDDNLESHGRHLHRPFFPRLMSLQILRCPSLESVFEIHLPQGLPYLETLSIIYAPQLKQVFNIVAKEKNGVGHAIALPRLQHLRLEELINLSCFCSENYPIMSSSLKNLVVEDCPRLENFSIQQEVNEGVALLKNIPLYDSKAKGLVCKAKKLKMNSVTHHKNLIPNIDPRGLNELTSLTLEHGRGLECLIDTTYQGHLSTGAFFNLVELKIEKMKDMNMLCNGPYPKGFLQKLENMEIWHCMELISLPPLPPLQNLKKVSIVNCGQLQEVFETEEFIQDMEEPLLSNLTSLELKLLPELRWIWKGPCFHVCLQSLKIAEIQHCNRLKYLFSPSLAQNLVLLEKLFIANCDGLEHIITPELEIEDNMESDGAHLHPPLFPNLTSLQIHSCQRLEYVFEIPLVQGLPHLEFTWISDAPRLKQVFNVAKEKNGVGHAIALPLLQFIQLCNLTNLSCFCPQNYPIFSRSLKWLIVEDCDRLENFAFQQEVNKVVRLKNVPLYDSKAKGLICIAKKIEMDRVMYHKNLIPNVDPEGLNELTSLKLKDGNGLECLIDATDQGPVSARALFNLVGLCIEKMNGLKKLCNGPFPRGFLQKLEDLEICNCKELISLTPALQNLKKVRVIGCGQLQEVFQTENWETNQAPLMSNLTSLELKSLPELKWIWKGSCHFVNLQSLKVVEIYHCNRLKYLFSLSLAQNLVLLEQIKIVYCYGLEQVITEFEIDDNLESDGGHLHPPLLPNLKSLQIHLCPRLEYVFKIPLVQGLPHLEFICIRDAPQLKQVFSVANVNNGVDDAVALPRLQYLRLENLINLSCFCSENYPIVSPSLEELIIVRCPQLKGPLQIASLQYLRELQVTNCDRLKSLFSLLLARNLPEFKALQIECCEELEEIIEMDQTSIASSSRGHLQPISFPCLESIRIVWCSNLKSLFPISVIPSLSNIKSLDIQGVSKLEQVFGYQGESIITEDDQKEMVFPKLSYFRLSELPSIKRLSPMGYCYFRSPTLDHFKVFKCPKLATRLIMDLTHPVQAISEAPQQVQSNTTEGLTLMLEDFDNKFICNDISWSRQNNEIPLSMSVGETEIMIHRKRKIREN